MPVMAALTWPKPGIPVHRIQSADRPPRAPESVLRNRSRLPIPLPSKVRWYAAMRQTTGPRNSTSSNTAHQDRGTEYAGYHQPEVHWTGPSLYRRQPGIPRHKKTASAAAMTSSPMENALGSTSQSEPATGRYRGRSIRRCATGAPVPVPETTALHATKVCRKPTSMRLFRSQASTDAATKGHEQVGKRQPQPAGRNGQLRTAARHWPHQHDGNFPVRAGLVFLIGRPDAGHDLPQPLAIRTGHRDSARPAHSCPRPT